MNPCWLNTKFLCSVACIFLAGVAHAQKSKSLHFLQLPFEGLSHPTVNCIFQDQEGFLWLGTINGLNRYDGYDYMVYRSGKGGLSNNYINSISQDADGNLWVGTKYGLNILMKDGNHFKTYLPQADDPHAIIDENIEIVYRDRSDRMWVGSWGGLSLYQKASDDFINFSHDPQDDNSLSGNVVTSIMEDSKGRLWAGTAFSGLNLFDLSTRQIQRFQKAARKNNCISGNSISAIYEDEKGQIWVGAQRGGLNKFHEASQTFKWYLKEEKRTSIASNTVYSIIEDENGDLMVGGMNGGISVYNSTEDNFFRYDTDGNYNPFGSKASVFSHYKLQSGEIVIATSNGGVKIQDNYPTTIALHRHVAGNDRTLRMNNVLALCEGMRGDVWVGTSGGGLHHMPAKTGEFRTFPAFKDRTVNCLYFDRAGNLWIGTLENGLAHYDIANEQFQYYRPTPGEPGSIHSNHVKRLVENDHGLWIGTDDGVSLFHAGEQVFSHFSHTVHRGQKVAIGQVNGLLVDYTYKLWVASESGLHYYDEKSNTFRRHRYQSPDLENNRRWIAYFYEDSRQHIWMSSMDGKLTWLDVHRRPRDPVITNPNYEISEVSNIVEDANGFFWITCRQGLFKCEVNHDKQPIAVLNAFTDEDGLQGRLFNPNASLLNKVTGEIFVGGLNGLNTFNPSEMHLNPHVPPVVLTGLAVNGKSFEMPDSKNLSEVKEVSFSEKAASMIEVYFTALNYVKSQKNQYAYMLEGWDESWRYAGNRRVAAYNNLPPGSYHLKIKATNNHGIWNDKGAHLTVHITSQLWDSAAFQWGLTALGMVVLVMGFIGYRRKRSQQPKGPWLSELISKNHHAGGNEKILSQASHDKALVERAVAYVAANLDNDALTIESLCIELGLSRANLFRKIKGLTGLTVSNFIKDIRLEKAKLYLDANPRSVGEVAYAIGFKSHAHFTRSFKEKFGVSPSAYVQGQL